MKKYSVLGMSLIAVSALVAAVTPSQASRVESKDLPGTLVLSEGQEDFTCTVGVVREECDYSITVGKADGVSLTNANTAFSINNATNTLTYTTEL